MKEETREDWTLVQIDFDHFMQARTQLSGWGAAIQVLTPEALRLSIIDYAKQTIQIYREGIKTA